MLLLESRGPGHLAEARTTKKPLQQEPELWKGSCRGRKRRKENPWPLPCPAPLLWASSASSSLSPVETQPPGPVPETQSGEVRMGSESKRAQDQHDVASMICPLSSLLKVSYVALCPSPPATVPSSWVPAWAFVLYWCPLPGVQVITCWPLLVIQISTHMSLPSLDSHKINRHFSPQLSYHSVTYPFKFSLELCHYVKLFCLFVQ